MQIRQVTHNDRGLTIKHENYKITELSAEQENLSLKH